MGVFSKGLQDAYGPFTARIQRAKAVLGLFESGKDKFHVDRIAAWQDEFNRFTDYVSRIDNGEMDEEHRRVFLERTIGPIGREQRLAADEVEHARVAAQAAALVLTHSAIEEFLMDLIGILSRRNVAAFLSQVMDKRVRVETMTGRGVDAAIDELRDDWIKELSRAPLMKKFHCVVQLYGTGFKGVLERSQAQTLLEELDKHRQEAAHRSTTGFLSARVDELVRKVGEAGIWFAAYESTQGPGMLDDAAMASTPFART